MEKKKKYLLIIGIFIVLLSVVGVTYAYWTINLQQTGENNLTSSCFKVELLNEKNPILLQKTYPVLDSEAESLVPYTFTIKNDCDAVAKYQINLEILEDTTLDAKYVKYMLNEVEGAKEGKYLEAEVETTISNADLAYKIESGYLKSQEEKHYELRIYLDGEITAENKEVMNQSFLSKISITASYAKEIPKTLEETILALPKEAENSGNSGLYEVDHSDANITYTKDPIVLSNLTQKEYRFAGLNYTDHNIYSFNDEEWGNTGFYHSLEDCQSENNTGSGTCKLIQTPGENYVHNYVTFNGDIWRIIGIVNTINGQRVKLIRDESIGEFSWDTSEGVVNNGHGVNEWSESDIMKLLNPRYETNKLQDGSGNEQDSFANNSLYWDGKDGQCYVDQGNEHFSCNFINNKMPEQLKSLLEEVNWNIGIISEENTNVSLYYEKERGVTSWKGKVGLMYPSDFGYATIGNKEGTNQKTCQETGMYDQDKRMKF